MRPPAWLAKGWPPLLLLAGLTAFTLRGVRTIPFHPDESSLLFQSRDFEGLFTHPGALGWDPSQADDVEQQYRALNAPLPKYILGLGRRLAGYGPESVAVDWNWSESWQSNLAAGAYPPEDLLNGARTASALMLPAGLIFVYLAGSQIGGRGTGLMAALLLGTNSLLLLHGRRSMAEGTLFFGLAAGLWGALEGDRRPWLAGLGAALAFSAKQSAAPLLAVGLAASAWQRTAGTRASLLRNVATYTVAAAGTILILHPLLWSNPIEAGLSMLRERLRLVDRQVLELGAALPEQVLDTPGKRALALVGHTFFTPPQFAEVGNYLAETQASQARYLEIPGHALLRGLVGGGLTFTLALAGAGFGLARLRKAPPDERRALGLALLATALQGAALFATLPLPFQRYYVPILPFGGLWAGYALSRIGALTWAAARGSGGPENQEVEQVTL